MIRLKIAQKKLRMRKCEKPQVFSTKKTRNFRKFKVSFLRTDVFFLVLCICRFSHIYQSCFRQGDCKKYTCDIARIEKNTGAYVKLYTRLWNHNLQSIEPKGVKTEIEVEFVGSQREFYTQRTDEKCNLLTEVRVITLLAEVRAAIFDN